MSQPEGSKRPEEPSSARTSNSDRAPPPVYVDSPPARLCCSFPDPGEHRIDLLLRLH